MPVVFFPQVLNKQKTEGVNVECDHCGYNLPDGEYDVCPLCHYVFPELISVSPVLPAPVKKQAAGIIEMSDRGAGRPIPRARLNKNIKNALIAGGFLILAFAIIWFYYNEKYSLSNLENNASAQLIDHEACDAAIKQYENARQSGNKPEMAVQAGLVCEAYLNANDEENYQKWKEIERQANKEAGLKNE